MLLFLFHFYKFLYSNTTLVKVKSKKIDEAIDESTIQIQLLLKLNSGWYVPQCGQGTIQIQLLLKLNARLNLSISSVPTIQIQLLLKLNSPLVSIFAVSSAFKYNSC